MTDDLPFSYPDAVGPTLPDKGDRTLVYTPRKHRHAWNGMKYDGGAAPSYAYCTRCGKIKDEATTRRGKSARRLGSDQERRIERRYGPRKIGEYGDAVDHIGRDWKWQSKATRRDPPLWLAKIAQPTYLPKLPLSITRPLDGMAAIYLDHQPVVIRSYVRQGMPTRDWLFVGLADVEWFNGRRGYMVYPGSVWLDTFGKDTPE